MNMKAITKTMKMINYFQRQIPGNGMTTNQQFQRFLKWNTDLWSEGNFFKKYYFI